MKINYIPYTAEYKDQVIALCDKYAIETPDFNNCILLIAVQDGKVLGVAGLKAEVFIEPLICTNPFTANTLGNYIQGYALGLGANKVRAIVSNPELVKQMEALGFEDLELKGIIMEKKYG